MVGFVQPLPRGIPRISFHGGGSTLTFPLEGLGEPGTTCEDLQNEPPFASDGPRDLIMKRLRGAQQMKQLRRNGGRPTERNVPRGVVRGVVPATKPKLDQ